MSLHYFCYTSIVYLSCDIIVCDCLAAVHALDLLDAQQQLNTVFFCSCHGDSRYNTPLRRALDYTHAHIELFQLDGHFPTRSELSQFMDKKSILNVLDELVSWPECIPQYFWVSHQLPVTSNRIKLKAVDLKA